MVLTQLWAGEFGYIQDVIGFHTTMVLTQR